MKKLIIIIIFIYNQEWGLGPIPIDLLVFDFSSLKIHYYNL